MLFQFMINSDRLLSNAYYYNHITQHLLKGFVKTRQDYTLLIIQMILDYIDIAEYIIKITQIK